MQASLSSFDFLKSDESKESMNREIRLSDAEMPRGATAARHAPPCLVEMNGLWSAI
jgi:hypothetical protein